MDAVRSIAELKNQVGVDDTSIIYVLGYYTPGDGGGGYFYWDGTSIEADDTGTIIQTNLLGTSAGRWKRNKADYISVAWFGAIGNNGNNDVAFSNAITSALNQWSGLGGTVKVPSGRYSLFSPIVLNVDNYRINILLEAGCQIFNYSTTCLFDVSGYVNFSLTGDAKGIAEIRCEEDCDCIVSLFKSGSPVRGWGKIENISFNGNEKCGKAIKAINFPTGVFENNKFTGCTEYNIYAESCWGNKYINNFHSSMPSGAIACIALSDCTNSLLQGERFEPENSICIKFLTMSTADVIGGNSITIFACSFETSSEPAIDIVGTGLGSMDSLLIQNCFFEGISPFNIQPFSSSPQYKNIEISGCSIASPASGQSSLINGVDSLLITNTYHKMPITIDSIVNNFVSICNTFYNGTTYTLTYNGVNPAVFLP